MIGGSIPTYVSLEFFLSRSISKTSLYTMYKHLGLTTHIKVQVYYNICKATEMS